MGTKHQIDYILVRKKWWDSVKNVEVYNPLSSVGSDHRIVSMRFQLKLRANCSKKANPEQCDWNAFRMNIE